VADDPGLPAGDRFESLERAWCRRLGLDVSQHGHARQQQIALRIVAEGVNALRSPDRAFVVITRRNSAPITETVRRVAVGAAENLPIVLANNLRNALDKLKEAGVWVAGTSDHKASQSLYNAKLTGPLAIVLGAEGDGIRHLTAETCDLLVSIPMLGTVPCLNVSVAAGVCLFEVLRQRGKR
jgi:23S rRNA (guanosine2251-2'-O)-methyltransferase